MTDVSKTYVEVVFRANFRPVMSVVRIYSVFIAQGGNFVFFKNDVCNYVAEVGKVLTAVLLEQYKSE